MSSNVSISLAVSTATVTKVTILMTSCLTSVWILTSVWKADLIATRALILREGNKNSAVKLFHTFIHVFFLSLFLHHPSLPSLSPSVFSLDSLAVSLSSTLHVLEFEGKRLKCDKPIRALKESEMTEKYCQTKVKPRFNKALCNEVLGLTGDILRPSDKKIYGKKKNRNQHSLIANIYFASPLALRYIGILR